jgi:tRNA-guanine family transglycosylase
VLATCHNLSFIQRLVKDIQRAVERGELPRFKERFLSRYEAGGE